MMTSMDRILLGWIVLSSVYALALFGWDKRKAGMAGNNRTSEFHLLLASALGGWPGGFLGMMLFRHKTAKTTFKLKFGAAFLVWSGLLWVYWNRRAFIASMFA
jgi:uncharacterized membrane protein YsdA (DUF1294 family)